MAIEEVIAARLQIIKHCANLLLHLHGEKITQGVIEEFLEMDQTLWEDGWFLRTLISRIYVMQDGQLKIFFIDGTISQFDMDRQKKSVREKIRLRYRRFLHKRICNCSPTNRDRDSAMIFGKRSAICGSAESAISVLPQNSVYH